MGLQCPQIFWAINKLIVFNLKLELVSKMIQFHSIPVSHHFVGEKTIIPPYMAIKVTCYNKEIVRKET